MPISARHRHRLFIVLSILAGLLAPAAFKGTVVADETRTFMIPADDGYGVQDCFGKDRACAQVVASAWCEAHGLSGPLAYGRAADMTGAIPGPQPAKLNPDAFVITCKD